MTERSRRQPKLGYVFRRGSAEELAQQARAAYAAGVDSLWIADHITGFPVDAPVFEPFSALSALSREAPGCELGVAVTDAFRRNPAVLAQAAMTVQAFAGVPLVLGVGLGEAMNLTPYGIAHDRPVARLKDTVLALKALGESSMDNPVDQDGEGVRLRNAYLQQPTDAAPPQIFLGTNGPRGRALVGEVADGWLPITLTPDLIRRDVSAIKEKAESVGRDPSRLRVAYHVWLGVGDDAASGLRLVAHGVKSIFLGFPHLAERLGTTIPSGFDWQQLEVGHSTTEQIGATVDQLPDDLVRGVAIYGNPQDCAERISDFADAGVTDFILRTVNPLDELKDCLSAVIGAACGHAT